MPHFNVHMFEEALDGEVEPALHVIDDAPRHLIASITDAMAGVLGDDIRAHLAVTVVGIPTGRSGVAGEVVQPSLDPRSGDICQ